MKSSTVKTLFGALIITAMMGCGSEHASNTEDPQTKQDSPLVKHTEVNPAFIAWQEKHKERASQNLLKPEESSSRAKGYIPPLLKPTVHDPSQESSKNTTQLHKASGQSAAATKFDYRDPDGDGNLDDSGLTAIRDQGTCGACWAFASYGALEGTLFQDENIAEDFSENNLKHRHGFEVGPCAGGNMQIASAYLARGDGPVRESDDPYTVDSTQANSSASAVRYIDNIISLPVRSSIDDNQYLKEALINHGPLYVDIHVSDKEDEPKESNNWSLYNDTEAASDHAVVLVGWDDAYEAQGQTGAFIVRNSWGTDWGEDGYFYVPYADQTFAFGEVAYFEDIPDAESFSFDIVHDTAPHGAVGGFFYTSNGANIPIYGASVYDITSDQTINAIGIYNVGDDTSVEVTIFKQVSLEGSLSFSEPTTPETFTGIKKGWNTLQLQTPIDIDDTQNKFAVQVRITESNDNKSWLPYDGTSTFTDGSAFATLETLSNQSFESSDGTSWNDLHNDGQSLAIKVFAQSTQDANTAPTTGTSIAFYTAMNGKLQHNDKFVLSFSHALNDEALTIVRSALDTLFDADSDDDSKITISVSRGNSASNDNLDVFFHSTDQASVDIDITTARNLVLSGINENGSNDDITFVIQEDADANDGGDSSSQSGIEQDFNDLIAFFENQEGISEEDQTAIDSLIESIRTELDKDPIVEDAIRSLLDDLYVIKGKYSNEGGDDSSNANETIITGTVTLPTGVTLTAPDECFDDNNDRLASCNGVFITLFSSSNNEFLAGTIVETDGTYRLSLSEIAEGETLSAYFQIDMHIDGFDDSYYLDFGADHTLGGSDADSDSFRSRDEIEWTETNEGPYLPNVNHLNIDNQGGVIDLDLNAINADKHIVSGTVTVPEGFVPGEIRNAEDEWIGWRMVIITAINTSNGQEYRTEIGKTESATNTYPFKLSLPNTEANYVIKIGKISNIDSTHNLLQLYLKDDGNHGFNDGDKFISDMGIMWNEVEGQDNLWLPDTEKTGYFTINDNISDIAMNIAEIEASFKKIEGTVTPPIGFNLTDEYHHMYIDLHDARTGDWLTGTHIEEDGSYSLLLGDTLSESGYIIRVNQEYWDRENSENSWWQSFYLDFEEGSTTNFTIKDEMEVRWEESIDGDETYWVPNVTPLKPNATISLTIDFANNYTAPTVHTISGQIHGIPEGAKWTHIHLYDPINHTGKGEDLAEDGNFAFDRIKSGKYIVELHYDIEKDNEYSHYHYIIVSDGNGNFSALDGMDTMWVPYDSDGNEISETTMQSDSFDWDSSVAFWAPEVPEGKVAFLNLMDDVEDINIGEITITPAALYNVTVNLSGIPANQTVGLNLFVPNAPIGRWEEVSSDNSGELSFTFKDLKARDDYQLSIWINGLGEYWYDGDETPISDIYWVGTQDGEVCDDWQTETWTCNWEQPIEWGPKNDPFSINEDTTLSLTIPNDKATVTATLALGSDYANQWVDVNFWQPEGTGHAWQNFQADGSGNVNVSMPVKIDSDNEYRMEIYSPDSWDSFVVDLSSDGVGGSNDSLILGQNSWKTDGAWGPKTSTLISVDDDIELGTLNPPELQTVTFNINNLDSQEEIFIGLENVSTNEWYGNSNVNWSDWQNPVYSNSVTIKVPAGDYLVMIHPHNHRGGLINNGNNTANETITANSTVTSFDWNWEKADKISVSNNSSYTITLPSSANLKSISGTVNLGDGDIEAGWIHAWNDTDGNGAEVASDGSFEIKGLTAGTYTLEYWAWNDSGDFIRVAEVSINDNVTNYPIQKSATQYTYTGTVTNISEGANTKVSVLLLDIDGNDNKWEVIDTVEIGELANGANASYSFTVQAPLNGHSYAVAVGVKDRNDETGATTFEIYEATNGSGDEVTLNPTTKNNTNSVSITVTETTTN